MPGRPVETGDTFAVPLDDGRFGAVRVLRTSEDDDGRVALVAVTPWVGEHVPDVGHPLLRQILTRHRGFFGGRPAICWYGGKPPADFVYLGSIPPTEAELAIDPQGTYGGQWHRSMARDVVLELGPTDAESTGEGRHAAKQPRRPDLDRITGVLPEEEFWRIIQLLDWEAPDDDGILAPAIAHLAVLPPDQIAGFHRVLCEKLHQLDSERFAREIGDYSYGSPRGFSTDHFLDVRCAVVANGRQFYEAVLSDPRKMLKDREFEPLLTLSEKAYWRKTGRTPLFVGAKEYETFSNKAGWQSDKA